MTSMCVSTCLHMQEGGLPLCPVEGSLVEGGCGKQNVGFGLPLPPSHPHLPRVTAPASWGSPGAGHALPRCPGSL